MKQATTLLFAFFCLLFADFCQAQSWKSLYDSSNVYFNNEAYDKAIAALNKALPLAKSSSDSNLQDTTYASTLYLLGDCYWWAGYYPETEAFFKDYLAVIQTKYGKQHAQYISRMGDLAALYYDMGRYNEAEVLFKTTILLDRETNRENRIDHITTLNNLAVLYDGMGRYELAEPLYKQVVEGYLKLLGNKHPSYATAINNLAALYYAMGRYTEAELLLLTSVALRKDLKNGKDRMYATGLHNLAGLYFQLERYEEAEKLLKESMHLRKELVGEKHPEYLNSLNSYVRLCSIAGRMDEALQNARQLISSRKEVLGEKHPDYANAINNLAGSYIMAGKYTQALPHFQEVLSIRKEVLGEKHPEYAHSLNNLAAAYIRVKDWNTAEKTFVQANSSYLMHIKTFFPGLSEKEKKDYFESVKSYFESFHTFALFRNSSNPAITGQLYNNQLSTKALLLQATRKVRQHILSSADTALLAKYEQWQMQREGLARYYKIAKAELATKGILLDSLEYQANALEKELSAQSEVFAQATDSKQFSWQDVQQVLAKGEAALEMIRFRKYNFEGAGKFTDTVHYAALVVTPDSPYPQLVLFEQGNAMETGMLKAYQADIKNRTIEAGSYAHYFAPLKEVLSGVKKLYFSADGVYNQINLNSLYNKESRKYLLDELDIVLVTSTKDLLQPKPASNPALPLAILIGYPAYDLAKDKQQQLAQNITASAEKTSYSKLSLQRAAGFTALPGTKQEIEKIAALFTKNKKQIQLYTGEEALEETVKSVSNPQVLHIATHGYFEKDADKEKAGQNPLLRAGLFLAGAATSLTDTSAYDPLAEDGLEDGILTAYEAMNLSLEGTELVVLSACETGLGEIKNGEGVYGLQRAFKVAGAESLLMSLWKVDDKTTQELMSRFYKGWLQGKSKTAAFKQAQKKLRKSYKDPYYWAAFVLVGE